MSFLPDFSLEDEEILEDVSKTEESSDNDDPVEDPNAKAAFEYYKEKGFLTIEDEFDGTFESLMDVLDKQFVAVQQEVEDSVVQKAPSFVQPLIELVLAKGQQMTQEEFMEAVQLATPTSIDLNVESQARAYLQAQFVADGMDEDEVEEELDDLEAKGKLKTYAQRLFKKEQELNKALLSKKVTDAKDLVQNEQERLNTLVEEFNGNLKEMPWGAEAKKKIGQEFITGGFKNKLEQLIGDPKNLPHLVAFISSYDGKELKLEEYKKSAFTAKTQEIKEKVKKYWESGTGEVVNKTTNKSSQLDDFELIL